MISRRKFLAGAAACVAAPAVPEFGPDLFRVELTAAVVPPRFNWSDYSGNFPISPVVRRAFVPAVTIPFPEYLRGALAPHCDAS